MSETSQIRTSEMPSGKRAIEECDPLGVLSYVVSTHMNNKRHGETFNIIIAIRNYYSNKMTANKDLAAYYSSCRTLLFIKNKFYRLADEETPEHTDEFHSVLCITGLNTNYSENISTFRNKVRPWPQSMAEANHGAANFLTEKPVHNGAPPNSEKRNVFGASRSGRAGSGGEAAEAATTRARVELRREGTTPLAARIQREQALPIEIGRPPRTERGVVPYRSTVRDMGAATIAARRANTVMSVRSRRGRTHQRVTLLRKSKCHI